jgi:hypothetical protein
MMSIIIDKIRGLKIVKDITSFKALASYRVLQPVEIEKGDYVQIINEEEPLQWFIGRWYTIGKIREGKESGPDLSAFKF